MFCSSMSNARETGTVRTARLLAHARAQRLHPLTAAAKPFTASTLLRCSSRREAAREDMDEA